MKRFLPVALSIIVLLAFAVPTAATADDLRTLNADRVLIFNPLPYDRSLNKLESGTLEQPAEQPTQDGAALFTAGMHKTGRDRTTAQKDPNTHDFWVITNLNTYAYDKLTFRLADEGEHCLVWTLADESAVSFTDEEIAAITEQFETVIYPSDTEHFGPFRDLGGDGKLNIITYDMRSLSVCGFFDTYDLYSEDEIKVIDPDDSESYNCLPIINVNTRMAGNDAIVFGTLAHEFQHLILRSAVLESPANADRLGAELTPGVWLNEAFAMEAEELAYPGSVDEQGYLGAYNGSQKVRNGMSLTNFDASGSDVGAYGQSFLFAEYLKALCGENVFRTLLDNWRAEEDASRLTEAEAIKNLLNDEQIEALNALPELSETAAELLETEADRLFSKLNLAFHLAVLLQEESGIFSIGKEQPSMPVYESSGRKIEGGGALLISANGSFAVPMDADSGLIFVGIRDGEMTDTFTVQDPLAGFYALTVCCNDTWMAIPASPSEGGILAPMEIEAPTDGFYTTQAAAKAIFTVERTDGGYLLVCEADGARYALTRTAYNEQNLAITEEGSVFRWGHFADGTDRLQADGTAGRAILYGSFQKGFGYFAPGYFDSPSFAKLRLIPVRIKVGDTNFDGQRTAADAAMILRYVVGLIPFSAPQSASGDITGDQAVTAADAAAILRMVVGLIPQPEDNA